MIPILGTNSRIFELKNDFLIFASVKPLVGSLRKFRKNLEPFDTNLMGAANCGYMISIKKRKNELYGGENYMG